MLPHPDRQFMIVLLGTSAGDPFLYFMQSQPARPTPDFTRDWVAELLADAAGDAARFEEIANARFSSAGLGEHACRRSVTLECHSERLDDPDATEFLCSERAAAEVYTTLRGTAFYDHGSAVAMMWCLTRCLEYPHATSEVLEVEARVRELLDAHTDPAADALRDVFVARCGLGYVDAAGWLPGEWGEPLHRLD